MSDVAIIQSGVPDAVLVQNGNQVAVEVHSGAGVPAPVSAGMAAAEAAAARADRLLADDDLARTNADAGATAADRVAVATDRTATETARDEAEESASDAADQVPLAAAQVALALGYRNDAAVSASLAGGYASTSSDDRDAVEAERAAVEDAIAGAGGSLGTVTLEAADKDVMAALDTSLGLSARVTHKEHGGAFSWVVPNALQVPAFQANVAADTGRGVYVAPAASTGKATDGSQGYWVRSEFDGFKRPEWFDGFVGDGVASDQVAFTNLHNLASHLTYCRIRLTPRTYMVGDQVPDATFYRNGVTAISAGTGTGITSLIVEFNGATLKTNPGFKYGTFDPATGLPLGAFSTADANTALAPTTIAATGCDFVWLTNVNLDGNPSSFTIGNNTDSGTLEAHHYGIRLIGCGIVGIVNFKITGFLQDCLNISNTTAAETDTRTPHYLVNGVLDGGGRCCLSILGGVNRVIDDVQMINPGASLIKLVGGHGTSPNVPCDIEAEGPIRQVTFRRCSFEQGQYGANSFTCGSSDTKGVLFDDCLFVGKHLPNSPRMTFRRCRFYGPFVELYTNALSEDAMVFDECFLTDATFNDTPLQTGGGNLFFGTGGDGVRFEDTTIDVSRHKINAGNGIGTGRNVWTLRFGTEIFAGGTAIVTLGSGYWDGLKLVEAITANVPPNPYIVTWTVGSAELRDCEIVTPLSKLLWKSTSGFSGLFNSISGRKGIEVQAAANFALDATLSKEIQLVDSAFAANKAATLPAPVAGLTRRYRFIRSANATGNFSLTIQTSAAVAVRALTGPSTECEVLSDGGAEYVLVGSGKLQDLSRVAIGYDTGAGATVAQTTSKSTAVTINNLTGQITTNAASLAAGANVTFTVNNNKILATDVIMLSLASGPAAAGSYDWRVSAIAAGLFKITVENRTAGALAEALVFNFAIFRGQLS